MNDSPFPLAVLLLQWTLLLTLGWAIHGLLRNKHPGWRLILWRSLLCFGVALPFAGVLRVPRINVPLPGFSEQLRGATDDAAIAAPVEQKNLARVSNSLRATRPADAPTPQIATPVQSADITPDMRSQKRTP